MYFTTYIFDLAYERGEQKCAPFFLEINLRPLANRRAYRLIVTFKVWGEEFPSMILNFLSDSTRVLCYTIIMLST